MEVSPRGVPAAHAPPGAAVAAAGCGGDDAKGRATQLLDVYALKIQMLTSAQGGWIRVLAGRAVSC